MKISKKRRKQVRDELREKIFAWYLQQSGFNVDDPLQEAKITRFCEQIQFCEDHKLYNSKVLYWIEPPILGVTNPVVIEESIGDGWTASIVPMKISIKSVGGLVK